MDKYKIIKQIGKGNYGKALLVRSIHDQNLYVMKIIDTSNFNKDQIDSAQYEVNVLKSLNHPYVIKYIESFYEKNFFCIVMEYADCGDMNKLVKSQNQLGIYLKEEIILNWFVQLCFAIKYIHEKKILHRDLKLGNIFLCSNGDIKLGDFGIAKILNTTNEYAKTLVGTPYYLSPELCLKKAYNKKSDIWSLGCVLYELMYLRHAFEANNIGELILKILKGDFGKMENCFSKEIRELIKEILVTNCDKRPSINDILNKPLLEKYIKLNLIKQITQNGTNETHSTLTTNQGNSNFGKLNIKAELLKPKSLKTNIATRKKTKEETKAKELQSIINSLKEENSTLKSKLQSSPSRASSSIIANRDYFIPDYSYEKREKDFVVIIEIADIVKNLKCSVNAIEQNYYFKFSGVKHISLPVVKDSKCCYYSTNRKEGKFLLEFTVPIKEIQLVEKKCRKLTHENGVYMFYFELCKEFEEQHFDL